MSSKKANNLVNSTSPYLQQHAYNPVNWYPWGEEAHNLAIESDKPILLSIGYSSCHWCHVMERESFENDSIAGVMNDNFVSIKVDREERPDVDQVYMDAIQALGSQGGWPLTVFLTPTLKPIYGGTYFPPESFKSLMNQIASTYKTRRAEIESSADQVILAISSSKLEKFGLKFNPDVNIEKVHSIYENLLRKFDREFGGMQRAPKFPMPGTWKFLLHYGFMFKDSEALKHTLLTLDKISDGGIYDQIGGGFARYSTDKTWHVPHFEKMLYDNGQLLSLYALAYSITKSKRYLEVMKETVSWLDREMTHPEGGFYSALDADSEGIEGKYYVWSWDEFAALAGDNINEYSDFFGVTKEGNWEGSNILLRKDVNNLDTNQLAAFRRRLLDTRKQRVKPGLDDKILCSWNALMSIGLIDSYNATGEEAFLEKALKNVAFIEKYLFQQDRLIRSWKDGLIGHPGFLEDYALTTQMYFKLYEATFDEKFLKISESLAAKAIKYFSDSDDKFFYFSEESEDLIVRKKEILDNVIPSSNSAIAHCFYFLGVMKGDNSLIDLAKEMTFNLLDLISAEPEYASNWALLYTYLTYPTSEVAITGNEAEAMGIKIRKEYFPNKIIAGAKEESSLPLLADKNLSVETKIYVCRNHTCNLPVNNVDAALEQLLSTVSFSNQ